jgi:PTH1 family peptidyl-tRNA hydrolase
LVDWVLGHFPRDEFPRIREGIDRAVKAVGVVLDEGIEAGMNQFNAR